MKLNHLAKLFIMMLVVLGLTVGCASTPDEAYTEVADQATAELAIAEAKSTNAEAKAMGVEWRDTGKIIKQAEDALAAGDYAKAIELANKARRQAENAMKQARAEDSKLKGNGTLSASEDDSASRRSGGENQYEVVTGDNLWDISGKSEIYDNPYQWPLIYKANRSQIKDADLIYAGQVFDIDRDASASDVDAAVNHAKTRGAWSIGATEASDEAYLAE